MSFLSKIKKRFQVNVKQEHENRKIIEQEKNRLYATHNLMRRI